MEKTTLKKICKTLPFLIMLVSVINIVAVIIHDVHVMRLVRLASIAVFFGYYLMRTSQRNIIILVIFCSLLARDVASLFYEFQLGHRLYLILGFVVYGAICLERADMLKVITKDKSALIFTLLFIVLNTFALYEVAALVSTNFEGHFEPYLFYIYGVFMIIFGATAIIYNQVYNSNRSLGYILFMISFLISEVTSLFAYYFGYEMFFYVDRIAFVVGLGLFSYTVLETSNQLEEAEQYDMLS